MRNEIVTIQSQRQLAEGIFEMVLQGSGEAIRPGQFINIRLEGQYLRRPISICDWTEDTITIIYKTVGRGTEQMSRMHAGETLDILYPLGNGFDLNGTFSKPLLIGGGVGAPPMYGLCKRLVGIGGKPIVLLGFGSTADVFYEEQFRSLGAEVIVTTEDGSRGVKGFVTDGMDGLDYDSLFACGPERMLQAVDERAPQDVPGQMSFERRMGCGFGACMGCSCRTKYGSKRICVEGPVLERSEIVW